MRFAHNYHLIVDSNEISVEVCNPAQLKQTILSYTVYTIKGSDLQGDFNVTRRYSDFDHVRQVMVKKWPGCFVPVLPPKKIIGNSQLAFVTLRKDSLNDFCQQLSVLKHLWYSKQFQILLRSTIDIQKAMKQGQNNGVQDIIYKYKQVMNNLKNDQSNENNLSKIHQFQGYIKKILPIISNFKDSAKIFAENKDSYLGQFGLVFSYLFPEFEKNILATYIKEQNTSDKFIFANSSSEKLMNLINQLKNIIENRKMSELYKIFSKEQKQIQTFLQILKAKQNIQTKLKNYHNKEKDLLADQSKLADGKKNILKSLIKSNIEDQKTDIQKQIQSNKKKIQDYCQINELTTIILGSFEIPRFKQTKIKTYLLTIYQMSEFQIDLAQKREQLCTLVLQNKNLQQILAIEI